MIDAWTRALLVHEIATITSPSRTTAIHVRDEGTMVPSHVEYSTTLLCIGPLRYLNETMLSVTIRWCTQSALAGAR